MSDSAPNPPLPGRPAAPRPRPDGDRKGSPLPQGTPDRGTSKPYFLQPGASASSPPGSFSCYLGPRRCFPFRNSPHSSGVSSHPVPSCITPHVCVRLSFPDPDPQGSLGTPREMLAWCSRHAPQPAPAGAVVPKRHRPQVPSPEQTQREAAAGPYALSSGLMLPEERGDSRATSFPSQLVPTQDLEALGTRVAVMQICRPKWAWSRPARPAQSHCRGRRPREEPVLQDSGVISPSNGVRSSCAKVKQPYGRSQTKSKILSSCPRVHASAPPWLLSRPLEPVKDVHLLSVRLCL